MNSAMAQPRREAMAARGGLSHLLDNFEDLQRPSSPSGLLDKKFEERVLGIEILSKVVFLKKN